MQNEDKKEDRIVGYYGGRWWEDDDFRGPFVPFFGVKR